MDGKKSRIFTSSVGSDDVPYYYVYGYDGTNVSEAKSSENYDVYGALYNWEASKISCPNGWHLPSDEEWMELETGLGMNEADLNKSGVVRESGKIGKKLKALYGWH